MSVNASLFLARRYLKPKRSFVSIITLLSVLGPTLGVWILIVVLAVMAGFNRDIREKILDMQAHIQLRTYDNSAIADPEPVLTRLQELKLAASPVVEGPVLIQTQKRVLAKFVKGIVPETEQQVTDIHRFLLSGTYDIRDNEVLLGQVLASQCNLRIGDRFLVHSADQLNRMVEFKEDGSIVQREDQEVYVPEELVVAGIFDLGMYEFDSSIILMHQDKADDIFGLPWGAATSIQIRTADPFMLSDVLAALRSDDVFATLQSITWQQANQRLFGALRVEKNIMFVLLIFIMVVASFGIMSTLITIVIQKTRDIGILKALGATPMSILVVFVLQGGAVGALGTVLGCVLGLLTVSHLNGIADLLGALWGVEVFPPELYKLSQIPSLVHPSDVIMVVACAFVMSVFAALLPAIYAAWITPAHALRTEP